MVYETQHHVWFGTWTHGVKLFLWVRGSQSVISHEVCVSQSCLHWIIQYLSFNDIWIGICMQTVLWIDERRQTNFWFLAESLVWDLFSACWKGDQPSLSPQVQHCLRGQVSSSSCTVCAQPRGFVTAFLWGPNHRAPRDGLWWQNCHHWGWHHEGQEINPMEGSTGTAEGAFQFQHSHSIIPIPAFPFHYSHSIILIPLFPFQHSHAIIPIPSFPSHHSHSIIPFQLCCGPRCD